MRRCDEQEASLRNSTASVSRQTLYRDSSAIDCAVHLHLFCSDTFSLGVVHFVVFVFSPFPTLSLASPPPPSYCPSLAFLSAPTLFLPLSPGPSHYSSAAVPLPVASPSFRRVLVVFLCFLDFFCPLFLFVLVVLCVAGEYHGASVGRGMRCYQEGRAVRGRTSGTP